MLKVTSNIFDRCYKLWQVARPWCLCKCKPHDVFQTDQRLTECLPTISTNKKTTSQVFHTNLACEMIVVYVVCCWKQTNTRW